jgi:hypothetical protein
MSCWLQSNPYYRRQNLTTKSKTRNVGHLVGALPSIIKNEAYTSTENEVSITGTGGGEPIKSLQIKTKMFQ